MSRDSRPRVVRLDSSRSASRPRPLDATVLTHIITTQDEVGRAGLDPLKVVDVITRRAQELTRSSGAVVEMVEPLGVAVVVECTHFCMVMRGVQQSSAVTTTSSVRGCFESNPKTRAEFFSILHNGR